MPEGFIAVKMISFLASNEMDVIESPAINVFLQMKHRAVGDEGGLNMIPIANVADGRFLRRKVHPTGKRQGIAARGQGTTDGNGRQSFSIGVFEYRTFPGQGIDIGGLDPVIAIAARIIKLPTVGHDHDHILDFAHPNILLLE